MTTIAWSIAFVVAAIWCAERLVRATRAIEAVVPIPLLVGSWVALLTVRAPTPGRALLAFGLADLALLAISTLGVVRLLGGFEGASPDGLDPGDDGDVGDDGPPPLPAPAPRHPGSRPPVRRQPRPAGSRRCRDRHGVGAGGGTCA